MRWRPSKIHDRQAHFIPYHHSLSATGFQSCPKVFAVLVAEDAVAVVGWSTGPACWKMKSTEVDQGLFTDSYCKVCSAQLISESQRVAHYESRKHANKVRLYYMLHPVDGGCPAKKLRTDNGSDEGDVDKNKCCTLCNMSFTSAVVAQSHYQGKIHAKRLKLLLGEQPAITTKEASPSPVKSSPETSPLTSLRQRRDSDRYCQLCNAWFNNPGMAQQHYDGKKHKKNAARADLLEQLGKTLDMGEMKVGGGPAARRADGAQRCCKGH
uniref:zinc finger matrin-type protein 4 isoform X2 n=1 Tax=Scatophagus argus TaxID=75038 RepID=UPI001ED7FEBE|nr:zinc finger matrin-type protein 4 isoform X2 [Scatophagus argus]